MYVNENEVGYEGICLARDNVASQSLRDRRVSLVYVSALKYAAESFHRYMCYVNVVGIFYFFHIYRFIFSF